MKAVIYILPFLIILNYTLFSQEFGEIPEELLKLTVLPEDSEEVAAVIFDKAVLKITRDFRLELKRHVRIKVFKDEGKKEANIELILWHEDNIDDIEAVSFSPDGKEYELDSDNIFEEKAERTIKVSFPIPGVEAGSVFDYAYTARSDYISNLEPWTFQTNIYTKHSEVTVLLPIGFAYKRLSMNLEKYDYEEFAEEVLDKDNIGKKVTQFTWVCRNLPGVKEEPYTDNIEDNYAQMKFVLVSFQNEYNNIKFAQTWDDVAKRVYKSYSDMLEDNDCENLVNELTKSETNQISKANKIYDFVRTNIKTTEHKGLSGKFIKDPATVLKDKSGSTSEKSVLLINMLITAGLDAKPVLISTRKNGAIMPDFCDAGQFNRLICLLKIDNRSYFLYPASYHSKFGRLTPSTDVSNGLLIEEEKGSIIAINSEPVINSVIIQSTAKINSDKSLKVNSILQFNGFVAMDEYDAVIDKNQKEYVDEFVKKNFSNAVVDSFKYENLDSIDNPLILKISFTLPDYLEDTDELAFLTFPFFTGLKENPFIRPKRINPIDYEYPVLRSESVKIEIPDGYSVSQLPTKRKVLITDFGFNQIFVSGNNSMECSRTIDLKRRKIPAQNYIKVRSFYDELVSSSLDQIVLNKKNIGN